MANERANNNLIKAVETYKQIAFNKKCDKELLTECKKLLLSIAVDYYVQGKIQHFALKNVIFMIEDVENTWNLIHTD